MKGFWKIPKEWIQDKGMSWNEAGVLADIKDWPNATTLERAKRCGLTKKSVIEIMKRCKIYTENSVETTPEEPKSHDPKHGVETTPKRCKIYTKCGVETTPKEKEKKEIPPTPPIKIKKENIEEQEGEQGEQRGAALEENPKEKIFVPPTIEEIKGYCSERGNNIDAEAFFDFYNAAGWVYGKNKIPVKDWKSCIRTWERKNGGGVTKKTIEIAEGWKRAYFKKFGYEYMGDEKKPIAADFARCSHAIEIVMSQYNEKDVPNFCERLFTAMLNIADQFQTDRWSPEYTAKNFDQLFRKVLANGNSNNKGGGTDSRPSMVERTLNKYAAMYGSGQQDGGIGSQR